MADEKEVKELVEEKNDDKNKSKSKSTSKNKKGIFSRIWNSVFRLRGDDFEKRLQYITKEEATILSRQKRRSTRWRRTARNLIVLSVILEVVAVGYAIMTTRTVDLDWRMRSMRVLPMFLLPALSFLLYSGLMSFTKMCDRRDQKTLEKLRAERQAKIDELKERTNYYTTQQLIQKYDPDPAAKAAAASVLASKLGADSGLKVYLGDENNQTPNPYATAGKSSEVEVPQSTGLRKRHQSNPKSPRTNESNNEMNQYGVNNEVSEISPVVVDHYNPAASGGQDGGWIARIAALLVGEDPTQSYALICGNCHMHNGLVRKEEFPFITYYCPHCRALNKSKNSVSSSDNVSPVLGSSPSADANLIEKEIVSMGEKESASSSPVVTTVEERETMGKSVAEIESSEKKVAEDSDVVSNK